MYSRVTQTARTVSYVLLGYRVRHKQTRSCMHDKQTTRLELQWLQVVSAG